MEKSFSEIIKQFLALLSALIVSSIPCCAEEIKIVDDKGLTRAIKVAKEAKRVVLSTSEGVTECRATNVDGVVGDKVEKAQSGSCVFSSLHTGTWQIQVKPPGRWKAKIE